MAVGRRLLASGGLGGGTSSPPYPPLIGDWKVAAPKQRKNRRTHSYSMRGAWITGG